MRIAVLALAASVWLAACGGEKAAGCHPVPCVCADGASGTRGCGAETCVCDTGACGLRAPETFDFGGVPPGVTTRGEVILANDGGGACTIASPRLDGCEPAYGLEAPWAIATVPAGGTFAIQVAFTADGLPKRACALAFDVSDPAAPHRQVSLVGHPDPGCLSVAPASLSFDVETAGCAVDQGTVTVTNGCEVPLELASLTLDDPAFVLVAAPPLPAALAPGATVPIEVGFRPATGGDFAGTLRLGFGGPDPWVVSLAGSAGERPWLTESFAQAPRPAVDLLFVIDNGTSMADETDALVANLRPYLSYAQSQELDYRIGVTTTGLAPGGACPGGVGGGEDGRLFPVDGSSARVISPETPDAQAAWSANVRVGACRDGGNEVFEAALRALTPPVADSADDPRHPEPNDGNLGFLRPDAQLVVVAITDRDDTSPESVDAYFAALLALKAGDRSRVHFHAVTGDPATGCTRAGAGSAEPGDRLVRLVERTDGGVFGSICSPDWEAALREMSATAFPFQTCWTLTGLPTDLNGNGLILDTDGELEVSVNGTVTASREPDGRLVWSYVKDLNAVCFGVLFVPEPGSQVEVRYLPACE